MHIRTKVLVTIACAVATSQGWSGAALARGGGGGGANPPPAPSGGATLAVSPAKIAIGATGTGTVTLASVATSPVVVAIFDDYQNSPAVATMPASVTVPAGSRSAAFSIVGGDYPGRTFLVHLSTNQAGAQTQFYRTPRPDTDIISITNASQSQSGDVRFTATTDTPAAQLTARFNGTRIPLISKGGGVYEGRGQVGANQSGDVVVESDLLGCSAKNPNTPSGWHFC